MSLDIHVYGVDTCILPDDPNYNKISYEPNNKFVWQDFYTLNCNNKFNRESAFGLRDNAPIFVKDNNDTDFTWNTGIYTYKEFMKLTDEQYPNISDLKKYTVDKYPKTKYIFVSIF